MREKAKTEQVAESLWPANLKWKSGVQTKNASERLTTGTNYYEWKRILLLCLHIKTVWKIYFSQTEFIGLRGMWADCIVVRCEDGQST